MAIDFSSIGGTLVEEEVDDEERKRKKAIDFSSIGGTLVDEDEVQAEFDLPLIKEEQRPNILNRAAAGAVDLLSKVPTPPLDIEPPPLKPIREKIEASLSGVMQEPSVKPNKPQSLRPTKTEYPKKPEDYAFEEFVNANADADTIGLQMDLAEKRNNEFEYEKSGKERQDVAMQLIPWFMPFGAGAGATKSVIGMTNWIAKNPRMAHVLQAAIDTVPITAVTTGMEYDEGAGDLLRKYPRNLVQNALGMIAFSSTAQGLGIAFDKVAYEAAVKTHKLPMVTFDMTLDKVKKIAESGYEKEIVQAMETRIPGFRRLFERTIKTGEDTLVTVPQRTVETLEPLPWFSKAKEILGLPKGPKLKRLFYEEESGLQQRREPPPVTPEAVKTEAKPAEKKLVEYRKEGKEYIPVYETRASWPELTDQADPAKTPPAGVNQATVGHQSAEGQIKPKEKMLDFRMADISKYTELDPSKYPEHSEEIEVFIKAGWPKEKIIKNLFVTKDLGLINKVYAMNTVLEDGTPLRENGVYYFDIDNFGAINNTYGHPTGDLILYAVAKELRDSGAFALREGGEEFALVNPESKSPLELESIMRKIAANLKKKVFKSVAIRKGETLPPITLTGGYGINSAKADEKMLQAKEAGRRRIAGVDENDIILYNKFKGTNYEYNPEQFALLEPRRIEAETPPIPKFGRYDKHGQPDLSTIITAGKSGRPRDVQKIQPTPARGQSGLQKTKPNTVDLTPIGGKLVEEPSTKPKQQKPQKTEDTIKTASSIIDKKSKVPILRDVLVDGKGNLVSTDLEVAFVKKLENPPVPGMYQVVGKNLEKSKNEAQDYPIIPDPKESIGIINKSEFVKVFKKAIPSISDDNTRLILQGVFISVKDGVGEIASTDGRQLYFDKIDMPGFKDGQFVIDKPEKVLKAINGIDGESLEFKLDKNKKGELLSIGIEGSNGKVIVRVIDTPYPAYKQILKEMAIRYSVDKSKIENAIKELAPYAKGDNNQTVVVEFLNDTVKMTAGKKDGPNKTIEIPLNYRKELSYTPDSGYIGMPLRLEKEGNSMDKFGMNINFLKNAMNAMDGEKVYIGRTDHPKGFDYAHFTDKEEMYEPKAQKSVKKVKKGSAPSGTAFSAPSTKPAPPTPPKEGEAAPPTEIENKAWPGAPVNFDPRTEMPELVRLTRDLIGNIPILKRFMSALGRFTGARGIKDAKIKISAETFKNLTEATKILAHEIGHMIDWLPDYTLKRGNILGRLKSLSGFLKTTIDSLPSENVEFGDKFLSSEDRRKIRNKVTNEVLAEKGKTMRDYIGNKDVRSEVAKIVKERYPERVRQVINEKGLVTKEEVTNELKAVTKYWHPFDDTIPGDYLDYRYSSRELYAEAVSVLLNYPQKLQELAPKFYKMFWDNIERKPEVAKALHELDQILEAGPDAVAEKRRQDVLEMFKKGEELYLKKREEREGRKKSLWLKLRTELIDVNTSILDKIKELQKQGKKINPEDNPQYFLEEYNYLGGKIHNLLQDISEKVEKVLTENKLNRDDLGEYMFYKRVVTERKDIANPLGQNRITAQKQLDYLLENINEKQVKALEEAKGFMSDKIKELTDKMAEIGMVKPETYEKIATNKDYATFQVLDYLNDYVSAGFSHQIGTFKEIANPYTSTVLKMISMVRAIERQKTRASVVKFMQDNFSNEIKESDYGFDGKSRQIKDKEGFGTIPVYEDGSLKGYYVDPYIADSVVYTPASYSSGIIGILKFMNSGWFRPVYVSWNLGYQSFNFIRDFFGAWKKNPNLTLAGAVKLYYQSAPIAARRAFGDKPDATIKEMQEQGMLSVSLNDLSQGATSEDSQIEFLMKRYGLQEKESAPNFIKKFIGMIEKLGNFVEALPKIVGYKSRVGKAPIKEVAHDVRTYAGSPDFLRKGKGYGWYNDVFIFSNALKEGLRSDMDAAFRNPKTRSGYWWKTTQVSFLPKILMFLAASGYLGKKIKDNFDKQTEYDKTNYLTVPLGETDDGQAIYFRLPQDEFGRLIGGLFWKGLNMDKDLGKAVKEMVGLTAGQLPSMAPSIEMLVATGQYLTGQNPYDWFRGRTVLTPDEQKTRGIYGAKKYGRWAMNKLGFSIDWAYQTRAGEPWIVTIMRHTPLINRYIKITDYGLKEKTKEQKQGIEQKKAERRLMKKEFIGR